MGVHCVYHRFHIQGALNENMFCASDIDTEQKRSLFYKVQSFRQHKLNKKEDFNMDDCKPPFTITNKMLLYIGNISGKLGNINAQGSLSAKPHLRKNNQIRSVYSSLRIEANTLSLSQVRDVINGRLVLGKQKEIQEVKNAYEAYEKISSVNPYSIDDLNTIHAVMTEYLVDESGCFRKGEEGVFDGDTCVFMAPSAKFVPDLMEQLFSWMNREKKNIHPLILASVFHYEFVFIHPYEDGNGRMARLWHTAILTKWMPIFEYISLESQIEKFQDEYYDAIAKSHIAGNSNIFIEFMLKQIDDVLSSVVSENTKDTGNADDLES